jgi:hypothetical protein
MGERRMVESDAASSLTSFSTRLNSVSDRVACFEEQLNVKTEKTHSRKYFIGPR